MDIGISMEGLITAWIRNSILILTLSLIVINLKTRKMRILGKILNILSILILLFNLDDLNKLEKYHNKTDITQLYVIKLLLLIVNVFIFINI